MPVEPLVAIDPEDGEPPLLGRQGAEERDGLGAHRAIVTRPRATVDRVSRLAKPAKSDTRSIPAVVRSSGAAKDGMARAKTVIVEVPC